MADDLDSLWKIYEAIKDWIQFSDAKAAAIIAFYAILGGIFYPKLFELTPIITSNFFPFIFFTIFSFSSFGALAYCFASIYPKLGKKSSKSVIFFMDIADNYESAAKYAFEADKVVNNEFSLKKDISYQIWELSKVAQKKYECISNSINLLIISIISGVGFSSTLAILNLITKT